MLFLTRIKNNFLHKNKFIFFILVKERLYRFLLDAGGSFYIELLILFILKISWFSTIEAKRLCSSLDVIIGQFLFKLPMP